MIEIEVDNMMKYGYTVHVFGESNSRLFNTYKNARDYAELLISKGRRWSEIDISEFCYEE